MSNKSEPKKQDDFPQVDDFAKVMKRRLRASASKGHWDILGTRFSLAKAKEQLVKVEHLLVKYESGGFKTAQTAKRELDAICEQSADAANYAMMVADNVKHPREG
jgi:hypothetical protein